MPGAKPKGRTKPKRTEFPSGGKASPKVKELRPADSDEDFEHAEPLRRRLGARLAKN